MLSTVRERSRHSCPSAFYCQEYKQTKKWKWTWSAQSCFQSTLDCFFLLHLMFAKIFNPFQRGELGLWSDLHPFQPERVGLLAQRHFVGEVILTLIWICFWFSIFSICHFVKYITVKHKQSERWWHCPSELGFCKCNLSIVMCVWFWDSVSQKIVRYTSKRMLSLSWSWPHYNLSTMPCV